MEVHLILLPLIQGKSIILTSGDEDRTARRSMKGQLIENLQSQDPEVALDL